MNPTERSISPQISSSTSPIAMMMMGAASSDSQVVRLEELRKFEDARAK